MSDLTVRGIKIENLEKQVAELEADLAKCEEQKRGLATAAKTGMVAGNRLIRLELALQEICDSSSEKAMGIAVRALGMHAGAERSAP